MANGMRRTTIMSHGGRHNAQGVKGTHLAGTVPAKAVLDAMPSGMNTVGNLPELANPGTAGEVTRNSKPVQVAPGKHRALRMDEGIPVIPGGNRDAGRGPSTSRPQLDDASAPVPVRSSSGQTPSEPVLPEPTEAVAPVEPSEAPQAALLPPPDAPVTEAVEEPTEAPSASGDDALATPLPTSKRKLIRSKVTDLRAWCEHLKIVPEEYVSDDSQVTGDLMRVLVGDELGIEHGIELPEDEESEEEPEAEVSEDAPDEEQDED